VDTGLFLAAAPIPLLFLYYAFRNIFHFACRHIEETRIALPATYSTASGMRRKVCANTAINSMKEKILMRYSTVIMTAALLACFPLVFAQETTTGASIDTPVPVPSLDATRGQVQQDSQKGELFIVGKNEGKNKEDFVFKMGERVHIKATGDVARRLRVELEKTGASRTPLLLF
jgi:hypothetical protein